MKTITKLIIFSKIFVFIISSSLYSQNQDIKKQILGKWDATNEIIEGFENKTIKGEKSEIEMSIIFLKDNLTLIESGISFENIPFDIVLEPENTVLTFGNRKYFIQEINSEELVLIEDKVLGSKILLIKNLE